MVKRPTGLRTEVAVIFKLQPIHYMKPGNLVSIISRTAAIICVLTWITSPGAADTTASPPAAGPSPRLVATVEGISEYSLDNGLRLLLYPDNSQSKVTVNLTVLVGSRLEGYGETGMAHLLEHMVFKGTPRPPKIPKA